jgi:hypothetical protein
VNDGRMMIVGIEVAPTTTAGEAGCSQNEGFRHSSVRLCPSLMAVVLLPGQVELNYASRPVLGFLCDD